MQFDETQPTNRKKEIKRKMMVFDMRSKCFLRNNSQTRGTHSYCLSCAFHFHCSHSGTQSKSCMIATSSRKSREFHSSRRRPHSHWRRERKQTRKGQRGRHRHRSRKNDKQMETMQLLYHRPIFRIRCIRHRLHSHKMTCRFQASLVMVAVDFALVVVGGVAYAFPFVRGSTEFHIFSA